MSFKPTFTTDEQHLLRRIKSTILAIEPEAEIYLFGSRARGEATEESDWDVLVLLKGEVLYYRKKTIWRSLYDIELASAITITAAVQSYTEWLSNGLVQATPFYQNVRHDAVIL